MANVVVSLSFFHLLLLLLLLLVILPLDVSSAPSSPSSPPSTPTALTSLNSDRAARRFCDRLVELGVARELTGRDTFRLYGV